MTLALVLFMVLPSIVLLLAVVLVVQPRRRRLVSINETQFPQLSRLHTVTSAARIIAFVVGLIVVVLMTAVGSLGIGFLLAPAVFAGTQMVAMVAANLVAHNMARTPGIAGLEVRRMSSYVPRALVVATSVALVTLAATLIWTTATASTDDMGRPGRAFTYSYPCEGLCWGSFSPWPGSYYAFPLGISLMFLIAVAVVAMVITVRRPRNASDPEIVRIDDFVRARSAESIAAALGLGIAASLAAVCFLVSRLVPSTVNGVAGSLLAAGWAAVVVGTLAFGMSVWCVVALLLPGTGGRYHRAETSQASAMVPSR